MLENFILELYRYKNQIRLLIGESSIKLMCLYIYGAADAFAMCGYEDVRIAFSKQWWDFVDVFYGLEPGTGVKGWFNIILEHTGDEKKAIKTFYDLLSKYLRQYYPDIVIPE